MKKLTRKMLNEMVKEEIDNIVARKIWEQSRPKIRKIRNKLLSEGYEKQRVERIARWLFPKEPRYYSDGVGDFSVVSAGMGSA